MDRSQPVLPHDMGVSGSDCLRLRMLDITPYVPLLCPSQTGRGLAWRQ